MQPSQEIKNCALVCLHIQVRMYKLVSVLNNFIFSNQAKVCLSLPTSNAIEWQDSALRCEGAVSMRNPCQTLPAVQVQGHTEHQGESTKRTIRKGRARLKLFSMFHTIQHWPDPNKVEPTQPNPTVEAAFKSHSRSAATSTTTSNYFVTEQFCRCCTSQNVKPQRLSPSRRTN